MRILLLSVIIITLSLGASSAREIHVAKNGNDSNSGNSSSPYLTLQKAAGVAVAGDVVVIHQGTYEEILKPANSGSSGNPITFKGATGEKVVISAMQALSNWQHDALNVYKTTVNWDLGQDNMVLHGDKLMDLARWPNNTSGSPFPLTYNEMTSGGANYIEYSQGIPNWNWSNGGSLHFYGAAGFLAWKEYITSTTGTRVYFNLVRNENWIPEKHNPGYTGHGIHAGEFYLQGIRQALDYQNEWFYNSTSKTLYVQIEGGGKPVDGSIMMRKRTQTINITKNYIQIENLAVFGGSIDITGNNNKLYQVSSFYGNNTLGVISSFGSNRQSVFVDGDNNVVEKCEIAYGAGNGLRDRGDKNKVLNSYIHHFNFLGNYDCVLNTRGATNGLYSGNKLSHGGRDIIQAYGDNCEYAYNEIAWSNIVADDCGLLYTTNPRSATSSIHHNWFHDAHAKPGRHKAAGIYLDNDSKNWDVHHNVVWDVDWTNIQINWNGTNLDIFNNTFVKSSATMGAWHKAGTAFSNVKVWNNITDDEAISAGDQESEVNWEPQADNQNNLISKESFVDYDNNDFHLKANSEAIDFGRVISGITDGYSGTAPDVGAYEFGDNWVAGVDWDISTGPVGDGCYNLPGEDCNGIFVGVTGVTIEPVTTTLEVFETQNLVANIQPEGASNKSVTWSSSNSSVISVSSNGVIEGLSVGTAMVTVTTIDGGHTANCNVEVLPSTKTIYTLTPVHDAYLQGTTRFNTVDLRVESGNRVSYLMFDLSGVSGEINKAELTLTVGNDAGSGEIQVDLGNSTNWTESNLSAANAPDKVKQLGTKNTSYTIGSPYTWNLDEKSITSGGLLSLVVTHMSGNDVSFASEEYANATYKPVLRITTANNITTSNYYVATNGNDLNDGSETAPWKTIQKATSVAGPGDQVYIKKGIYYNDVVVTTSGEPDNRVTYDAFPGDELQVILEGADFKVKASYVRVSGIKVQNGNNGFYIEGPGITDIEISNNHTYNTYSSGIIAWGVPWGQDPAGYDHISNLKILNNKVQKACNGGYNECITIAHGIVGFEISGNEVYDGGDPVNGGEGIDVKVGCENGIVANNYVHNLTRRGIYLDGGGIQGYEVPFVRNVQVYNNIVHDCIGHGVAIMTEGDGDVYDVDIFNNVLYNNTDDGIMYYDHPNGGGNVYRLKAYNNTIYSNDRHGILLAFPRAYDIEFYNNICYGNGVSDFKADPGDGQYTASNNIFNTDPKFVDVANFDFHLQAGSTAINAGKSDGAPNKDIEGVERSGEVDAGAFEYVGTIINVSGVSVNVDTLHFNNLGETQLLVEEIIPSTATNKNVSWSSNNINVATVNDNGLVSAETSGSALITVITEDGGYTASVTVIVDEPIAASFEVDDLNKYKTTDFVVGGTIEVITNFSAGSGNTVTNGLGGIQVMLREVTQSWSVVNDYVFSDASVIGQESGISTVSVSLAGVPPTSSLPDGNFYFLFPRFQSSDGTIYSINGLSPINIIENKVSVTGVGLSSASEAIYLGDSVVLEEIISPDNATDKSVDWSSSNTSVASVSNGSVKGVGVGTAIVTVTTIDGGFTDNTEITVLPISVSGVMLNSSQETILVGETINLEETVSPDNATNKEVTWSSGNVSVATVNNGVVTGISEGEATVIVTTVDGGYTASTMVTVEPLPVDTLLGHTLPGSIVYNEEVTFTVNYEVSGTRDIHVDLQNTTNWTGHGNSVLTVSGSGTATFTFTPQNNPSISDSYQWIIYLTPVGADYTETIGTGIKQPVGLIDGIIHVTGISLDYNTVTITKGETFKLTENIEPDNAENKEVTWSTGNDIVASVNNGIVLGKSEGTAKISVVTDDGGYTASAVVTVEPLPIDTLLGHTLPQSMEKDKEVTFTVSYDVSMARDIHVDLQNTINWKGYGNAIRTVSGSGTVTFRFITRNNPSVNDNYQWVVYITPVGADYTETIGSNIKQKVQITERKISVAGISLNYSTAAIYIGDSIKLTKIIEPHNATNKSVTWSSTNPDVASVVDGMVKGKLVGNTTITATTLDGGFTGSATVFVHPISVTGLSLNILADSLDVGDMLMIKPEVEPQNATNKNVRWFSDNENVLTVDEGTVKGVSVGKATVTAVTVDGSYSAQARITVRSGFVRVTGVELDYLGMTLFIGDTTTLTATVYPLEAHNRQLNWSSDNPEVIMISKKGKVHAITEGEALVTVTTEEGNFNSECLVKVISRMTGIHNNYLDEVMVFPVPFKNVLNIDQRNGVFKEAQLIDINGRVIFTKELNTSGTKITLPANSQFPSGLYVLKLIGEGTTRPFTIVRE